MAEWERSDCHTLADLKQVDLRIVHKGWERKDCIVEPTAERELHKEVEQDKQAEQEFRKVAAQDKQAGQAALVEDTPE